MKKFALEQTHYVLRGIFIGIGVGLPIDLLLTMFSGANGFVDHYIGNTSGSVAALFICGIPALIGAIGGLLYNHKKNTENERNEALKQDPSAVAEYYVQFFAQFPDLPELIKLVTDQRIRACGGDCKSSKVLEPVSNIRYFDYQAIIENDFPVLLAGDQLIKQPEQKTLLTRYSLDAYSIAGCRFLQDCSTLVESLLQNKQSLGKPYSVQPDYGYAFIVPVHATAAEAQAIKAKLPAQRFLNVY